MIDQKFKNRLLRESSYPLTLSLLLEDAEEVEDAQKTILYAVRRKMKTEA